MSLATSDALPVLGGVCCPNCSSNLSDRVDVRRRMQGFIWRRRECCECGTRYTTKECVVWPSLGTLG